MRPVTAEWIAAETGGVLAAPANVVVTSVVKDSREAAPGSLYVAFPGARADGHDFVAAAAEAGAALHLVTRPVDAPHVLVPDAVAALGSVARAYLAMLRADTGITVVGVTGSNGKTTTKDLLGQLLPDAVAPVGSYNNEIGLPLTVLRADAGTRHLVLEMGANATGNIAYLTSIAPLDIAVVLNVGTAHVGEYPDPEALAAEKASILDGLREGGLAVLNADDARVSVMARAGERTVSFGGRGDVSAEDIVLERGRPRFTLRTEGVGEPVRLGLVGEHHVSNALAAAAVARACGVPLARIAAGLTAARPLSPHRMAVTDRADGVTVIDDSYNASPESMRAALRALLEVADGGDAYAVVGEMLELGEHSRQAHADLGETVVRLGIPHLLVVGEGARPAYDAAVREGSWGDEAAYVTTIEEAHGHLASRLRRGDTVLVKASHGSGLWRLADRLVEEGEA